MSDPAPQQYKEIVDGKVPLTDLYERGWQCARYNMPEAFELDRALRIRLTIEDVNASKQLRESVDKLNRDTTRIALIAIFVALVSLIISIVGIANKQSKSEVQSQQSHSVSDQ